MKHPQGLYFLQGPTNKALLGQLHAEPPGDLLQLPLGVFPGVDLDPALGTAEGDVHHGTLVRHQRGQGFYFVLAHVHAVSDTWMNHEKGTEEW